MRSFASLRMTERAYHDSSWRHRDAAGYHSNLRITRADSIDAAADALLDPDELLEDLLAVGHAAIHLLRRLAGQQQRRTRYHRGRLTARIVKALDQLVVDGAGRRHDARGRHAGDGDAALARHFLGEALGEALERSFGRAVHHAAA